MEPQPNNSGEIGRKELVDITNDRGEGSLAANLTLVFQTGHRIFRHRLNRLIGKGLGSRDAIDWRDLYRSFDAELFEDLWEYGKTYQVNRKI